MRPLVLCSCLAAFAGLWLLGRAPSPAADADKKQPPTFAKDCVAFLQKHCVRCHGPKVKRADLVLAGLSDDQAVLKHRKTFQAVLKVLQAGEMPPKPRPRPDMAEVEAFTASVRAVFARADRNTKPDPGRVTIRRLNRAEYNNTIRDLIGIDFNPAEDFPSNDIGHGFDNISDVLTL